MKYSFAIYFCCAVAFAQTAQVNSGIDSTDSFALYVVNNWLLSSETASGLDVYISPTDTLIIGVDASQNILRFYSTGGVAQSSIQLDASNTNCYGVAWNNSPSSAVYHTNDCDYVENDLYYTEDDGLTWEKVTNPTGHNGRGMDFFESYYWEANQGGGSGVTGVCRFVPGGTSLFFPTPEVGAYPSGLTVFPFGGNTCVAIASAVQRKFFFFQWDVTSLTFMESIDCPVSGNLSSYGLAYNEGNGHIYWSYRISSEYHLVELSFEPTALERLTWASVKSGF